MDLLEYAFKRNSNPIGRQKYEQKRKKNRITIINLKTNKMEAVVAGNTVNLTEDGYLVDFSQWTKEIGTEIAKQEGIEMTDRHWEVIKWIQEQVKADNALSVRGIKKSGVLDIKEFYALFPGGPLKLSTKIAGVPKPKSCI